MKITNKISAGFICFIGGGAAIITGQPLILAAALPCLLLSQIFFTSRATPLKKERVSDLNKDKIPQFLRKRPPPLNLKSGSKSLCFDIPKTSPKSGDSTGDFYTPNSSLEEDSLSDFYTPREQETPRQPPPLVVREELAKPKALVLQPLEEPVAGTNVKDWMAKFFQWIAEMSNDQLVDLSVRKEIESKVRTFAGSHSFLEAIRSIRTLYKENGECKKHMEFILNNPQILRLIQDPISRMCRYLDAEQTQVFTLLGQQKYNELIRLFLSSLDRQPPPSQQEDPELQKKLLKLVEFLATKWTAQFAFEKTREELRALFNAIEEAKPLDCLRGLYHL